MSSCKTGFSPRLIGLRNLGSYFLLQFLDAGLQDGTLSLRVLRSCGNFPDLEPHIAIETLSDKLVPLKPSTLQGQPMNEVGSLDSLALEESDSATKRNSENAYLDKRMGGMFFQSSKRTLKQGCLVTG